MNSVLKSADGKDLILTCNCGCGDTIHFKLDASDPDFYFCMSYMSGNWYRDQDESMWRVFCKKMKKIWRIIRNKDHHYSDICMTPEEFDVFREYVNSLKSEAHSAEVAYICDKRYCESCDNPECRHTRDITHAKNFVNVGDNKYAEKED